MTFEGISLANLLNPPSSDTLLTSMLEDFSDNGIASTSWQEGQPELTIANVVAQTDYELSLILAQAIRAVYFRKAVAAGDKEAVYELAEGFFNEPPKLATSAVYTATITNDVGVAYPNRPVNSYLVENGEGVIFSNLAEFSLAGDLGATVDVVLTAQTAGSNGNSTPSDLTATAPLAGTSVSFVLSTPGTDDEDLGQLEIRCLNKWASQVTSGSKPPAGYAYIATKADASIRRAKVDPAPGRSSQAIDVYVAGESGVIADTDVLDACATYLQDRQAPTLDVGVIACAAQQQDVTGVVRVTSSLLNDTLKDAIREALSDYLRKLPIGGTDIDGTGYVVYSEVIGLITTFDGVEQVVLSSPISDVVVNTYDVVVPPDDSFPNLIFEGI